MFKICLQNRIIEILSIRINSKARPKIGPQKFGMA